MRCVLEMRLSIYAFHLNYAHSQPLGMHEDFLFVELYYLNDMDVQCLSDN